MAGFADTIKRGDRRASLEAIRDEIAVEIEAGVPARELAALLRRLESVIETLDSMEDPEGESDADRIRREREERRAATSGNGVSDTED